MKRLFVCFIPLLFLFAACSNSIDYTIKNTTKYNITVIDKSYVNQPEYIIKANSFITLKHPNSGNFVIKENSYPVEIINEFSYSEIKELKNIELIVYNNTDKDFVIKIINSTFPPESFNITQKETTLKIYTNNLDIKVFYNAKEYTNYILKDNSLMLF